MGYNWFTADMHFGHENIIAACDRPFINAEAMHAVLIRKWNERVHPADTVYHLGDFCFKGGSEGGTTKAQTWEKQLNGKIIHIEGNHDENNGTASLITNALMRFGGHIVLAQHMPPTMPQEIPEFVDFVICGHVHGAWDYKIMEDPRNEKIPIPMINVGVDVWDYFPVRLDELLAYYDKLVKQVNYPRLKS
jgi:calcineurin-like phosphoesterase family protein